MTEVDRERRDASAGVQHCATPQRPFRPGAEQDEGDADRDGGDDAGESGQAGVGGDEGVGVVDQALHERLLHDPRRLAGHEQGEGDRVEREFLQGRHEREAAERPEQVEARGDVALRVPEPVDGRPDQRRQDGERDHRDQEVQQHLLAGGVRTDVEEQRSGEAHRHERVGGGAEAVGDAQANDGPVAEDRRPQSNCPAPDRAHPGESSCRAAGAAGRTPTSAMRRTYRISPHRTGLRTRGAKPRSGG